MCWRHFHSAPSAAGWCGCPGSSCSLQVQVKNTGGHAGARVQALGFMNKMHC